MDNLDNLKFLVQRTEYPEVPTIRDVADNRALVQLVIPEMAHIFGCASVKPILPKKKKVSNGRLGH